MFLRRFRLRERPFNGPRCKDHLINLSSSRTTLSDWEKVWNRFVVPSLVYYKLALPMAIIVNTWAILTSTMNRNCIYINKIWFSRIIWVWFWRNLSHINHCTLQNWNLFDKKVLILFCKASFQSLFFHFACRFPSKGVLLVSNDLTTVWL